MSNYNPPDPLPPPLTIFNNLNWEIPDIGAGAGPAGPQGFMGATGLQGRQGVQGTGGSAGSQGNQGFQGLSNSLTSYLSVGFAQILTAGVYLPSTSLVGNNKCLMQGTLIGAVFGSSNPINIIIGGNTTTLNPPGSGASFTYNIQISFYTSGGGDQIRGYITGIEGTTTYITPIVFNYAATSYTTTLEITVGGTPFYEIYGFSLQRFLGT